MKGPTMQESCVHRTSGGPQILAEPVAVGPSTLQVRLKPFDNKPSLDVLPPGHLSWN